MKKRDRLTNDLQEVSAEDRKNKLETLSQELQTVDSRVHEIKSQTKGEKYKLQGSHASGKTGKILEFY